MYLTVIYREFYHGKMCYEKSVLIGIIGYVWTCFAVRSIAFVGTFGSVSVSLFRGVGRDF